MDKLELLKDPEIARQVLDSETKHRELGWLGTALGSNTNTRTHIVGLLLVLLVTSGIAYTFFATKDAAYPPGEFWGVLSPIITTLVGYLIGTSARRDH